MPQDPLPLEHHTEIACDESGFSGGNLVGRAASPVFAHASIRIEAATAAELLQRLRRKIGARGTGEYKSPEILRPRRRSVLLWLLGSSSPIHGNAHLHLTDTRFFVLARLVDVLIGPQPAPGITSPGHHRRTREMSLALYRRGEESYGTPRWQEFLTLSANLLRTNSRWLPKNPVETFYSAVESLAAATAADDVKQVMTLLRSTRPVAEATRASYLENPKWTPLMEPLLPALNHAVHHWGAYAQTLSVIHDEQSALTPERIADIATAYATSRPGRQLTEVRLVDSAREPRVQIAYFVAGIARRLASDQLKDRADPEVTDLLSPLINQQSVWVDQTASWIRSVQTKIMRD